MQGHQLRGASAAFVYFLRCGYFQFPDAIAKGSFSFRRLAQCRVTNSGELPPLSWSFGVAFFFDLPYAIVKGFFVSEDGRNACENRSKVFLKHLRRLLATDG